MSKNILMVTTNTDSFKNGTQTGVWLEEFARPYLEFLDNKYSITVSSLKGGISPIDKASTLLPYPAAWDRAAIELEDTVALEFLDWDEYDAIILPGGHGPMFDLAKSTLLGKALNFFMQEERLIGAICHGPAGFLSTALVGEPIVKGITLTSFTNEEERVFKRDEIIPYFLQDELIAQGANFVEEKPMEIHVEVFENIITAQNQNSSEIFAKTIVDYLSAQ